MPSCIASSFSHGDAFISSKPERTTTCTSSPPRRRDAAAAVHRRVAAAQHDDALADLRHVTERDRRQPVDADVDVRGRFAAAGNVEVAAARRAAADEDRVVAFGEQRASCCRCACRRGTRCPGRARSRPPRRSRESGRRNFGNLRCASCRPPAASPSNTTHRSRAARDRARRSATPARRRPARRACRSSSSRAWAAGRGCLP